MVVDTYVVEQPQQQQGASSSSSSGGQLVSMFSFYTLPSSVIKHPEHNELRAAYMFYTGACLCVWGTLLG
jgi:glycylpeptide N-tetradecanoyltransferase